MEDLEWQHKGKRSIRCHPQQLDLALSRVDDHNLQSRISLARKYQTGDSKTPRYVVVHSMSALQTVCGLLDISDRHISPRQKFSSPRHVSHYARATQCQQMAMNVFYCFSRAGFFCSKSSCMSHEQPLQSHIHCQ